MDLKRWLTALAFVALLIAPIGTSATAFAAEAHTAYAAAPTYHDHEGGEEEGEEEDEGEGEGEGDREGGTLIELLEVLGDIVRGLADVVGGAD